MSVAAHVDATHWRAKNMAPDVSINFLHLPAKHLSLILELCILLI